MRNTLAFIFTIILISVGSVVFAQKKTNATGLRAGTGNGLSIQHYMSDSKAFELIFYSRWRGFTATGLYEIHKPAFSTPNFYWYFGAGAHIGFYRYYDQGPKWYKDDHWNGSKSIVGLDGILGLEYFIPDIPIQLSIDWKPTFNLFGYYGFWGDEGAISVRYTF